MRSRTSASQACGSASFNFAVPMSVYMTAARTPPRSEPANSQAICVRDGDAAQRPLGGVVRKADAAVVEEAREAAPALEHVIHRLGHGGVARECGALHAHPRLEISDERRAFLLAHREPPLGGLAVDLALDVEERIDPLHGLQRQR